VNARKDSSPQRILIVKLSAIGDVIQTLPMVEALRTAFPLARIDWVVEEDARDLLAGHFALDRVIVSRRKSWQKEVFHRGGFLKFLKEIRDFLRELRGREYDWVIDNHGILKSGIVVFFSRGKRKIGFRRSRKIADEGNYLFTNERYRPLDIERHAVERYLDLAAQLGVPVDGVPFKYEIDGEARKKANALLDKNGPVGRPLVVIHPFARWETKQWPSGNFVELAEMLVETGASLVFTGSPGDFPAIEDMINRIRKPAGVLNLAGKTTLRELAAVFSAADLVVSTDTGPMHLAAAVGAPLIALFGPTAPWRTGPYGKSHTILRRPLPCSPCFKKSCPGMECMKSLSVQEVAAAVREKILVGSPLPLPSPSKGEG
jgi:heptosyltransferase I